MTTKYTTINNWTKKRMIERIREKLPIIGMCTHEFGGCSYRNAAGKACAVGAFIPDGHDGTLFRGAARELLHEYPDLMDYMPMNLKGLIEMQCVHDGSGKEGTAKQNVIQWIEENVED